MKKFELLAAALCLPLILLSACQKEPLPNPEYPLDAATIEAMLAECSLDYTVEEDFSYAEQYPGRSFYNLYSAESGKLAGGIISAQDEGKRFLNLFFPNSSWLAVAPLKECETVLIFAAHLFGGFESDQQVADCFLAEYDSVNTIREESEIYNSVIPQAQSRWATTVADTACRITLEQPRLNEPAEYLREIVLCSDWDTFYPEEEFGATFPTRPAKPS